MKVTTTGFKARDVALSLDKLMLLTGPNGAGKSSVSQALAFAFLSWVPPLGKRPEDTAALMSGDQMRVDVQLDDGRMISRELSRVDGALRTFATCSWLVSSKSKECSAEILRLVGREADEAAQSLAIRQLLIASPNERAAEFEKLAAAGRRSPEDLAKDAAKWTLVRLTKAPEDHARTRSIEALSEMVADDATAVLAGGAGAMLTAKVKTAGTATALEWANQQKRAAHNSAANKHEARKVLEDRVKAMPVPLPGEVQKLTEERDRLTREVGAMRDRIVQASRQKDVEKRVRADVEAATAALNTATAARNAFTLRETPDIVRPKLQGRRAEIQSELDDMSVPEAPDYSEADELLGEAAKLEGEAQQINYVPSPNPEATREILAELAQQYNAFEAAPWPKMVALLDDVHDALASKCKGTKVAAKPALDKAYKFAQDQAAGDVRAREDLRLQIQEAEKRYENEKKWAAEASDENDKRRRRMADLQEKARAIREQSSDRRAAAREAHALLEAAWSKRRRELVAARQETEAKLQSLDRVDARAQGELESAQANLDKAKARLNELQSVAVAEPEGIAGLEVRIEDVKTRLEVLASGAAARVELERLLRELKTAAAENEVYAAMEWALQRVRGEELADSSGPLLATLAKYLEAAGRAEVPYIRAGKGVCEVGWRRQDGREVSVEALSGGEWVLFAAGLAAAVVILRAAPIRLLLVEAGETDARTIYQLCDGIRAVSDGLTCAIVMTPHGASPEGWTFRMVGEEQEVAA